MKYVSAREMQLESIELCEGRIEVQSELGKGSVFIVKLPLGLDVKIDNN